MSKQRLDRELETRERTVRTKAWTRPTVLPDPTPEDGYTYHWVRISTNGQSDATNISSKIREGWEPVRAKTTPRYLPILWQTHGLRTMSSSAV
jgi:hypothetical protein